MPFEKGNKLGEKSRRVEQILTRACEQEDYKRVRAGCEAMLDLASTGDLKAIEFVRDTIDGKPSQSVNVQGGLTYGHILIPVESRESDPLAISVGSAAGSDTQGVH